jgi:hypothetical protein
MLKRQTWLIVSFIVVCLVSLSLSLSLARSNLHYFYHEDDAHHFNRTVEMAQRDDLNPHYFNKPALHFYLRIPVVHASVIYERLIGRMQSVRDIRTRDPYGLAGFSYTPSHPRVLGANRALSAIWSALLAVLVLLILSRLGQPLWSCLAAAGIVALSPEVLKNSYIIGVDTLMALGCLITTIYALWAMLQITNRHILTCAFLAGLTCAAKYNAAPICVVPLTLWWFHDRSLIRLGLVALTCIGGFLVGAPYSLLSFNEFWQGVSYEAWHYGVAGHAGHMAERGLPQALLYLRWLLSDGIGVGATVLAIVGASLLSVRNRRAFIIIISFPAAYALLMILQKAHFTRNMLVLVPYGAFLASCGLSALFNFSKRPAVKWLTSAAAVLLCLVPLACESYRMLRESVQLVDSRDIVVDWLQSARPISEDVAISGPLQFPVHVFTNPGVDAFNPERQSLASLIQAGYQFIVVPTDMAHLDAQLTEIILSIPGESWPQRVPKSPAISILRVKKSALPHAANRAPSTLTLSLRNLNLTPACTHTDGEQYCWITTRVTTLSLPNAQAHGTVEIMSPWPDQHVTVSDSQGTLLASTKLKQAGTWETLPIPLRRSNPEHDIILTLSRVTSPESQGVSSDRRRLGVAVREPLGDVGRSNK